MDEQRTLQNTYKDDGCIDLMHFELKTSVNMSQSQQLPFLEGSENAVQCTSCQNSAPRPIGCDQITGSDHTGHIRDHTERRCSFLQTCRKKCRSCVRPCMRRHRAPPPSESSLAERCAYSLTCPPHGLMARGITMTLGAFVGFGLMWSVTGPEGLPGGTFFGLFILFIACHLAGSLSLCANLPPLLGMLVMGFILGNVPYINCARHISATWSASIRLCALGVILTRAGLGLDPSSLKRMSCVVLRLSFLPCLVESVTCMITSYLFLGLPWVWGLMLGFVLSAVSPAVVVPSLLSLSERGYGLDKGIPTLVIAASSLDDVLAIGGFSICLGIAFSDTSNIALTVFKGPLEACAGMVYGAAVGVVLWYIPSQSTSTKSRFELQRSGLLLAAAMFALFSSEALQISGAGALGCLTLPFVAALQWRHQLPAGNTELPTERHTAALWLIFQPLLFGLIGAAVDISKIEDPTVLGLGAAVLLVGLLFRSIASFLAVLGAGLTLKERLFVPLAWLPKATVQALIGSIAYDTALRRSSTAEMKAWGVQILTIAVLSILITAPLGAAAIALAGPKLLNRTADCLNRKADINTSSEAEVGQGEKVDEAAETSPVLPL